jgi:hypothetical protein
MAIQWRYDIGIKQDMQYTYSLTLRRVRAITDAAENQYVFHILSVYF